MPAWVLISLVVAGFFGVWNNMRRDPQTVDIF
jgi:hypothetical protein